MLKRIFKIGIVMGLMGILSVTAYKYWDKMTWETKKIFSPTVEPRGQDCSTLPATPVYLVYITDSGYITETQTSILSAIKNKCPKSEYYITVIMQDMNPQDAVYFTQLSAKNAQIFTVAYNNSKVVNAETSTKRASLVKFFLPNLMRVDKVLYLDGDTLVLGDLTGLFLKSVQQNYAAAVKIVGEDSFNAGVLLLNLEKMRQEGIAQKATELQTTEKYQLLDQQVFNRLFAGKVLFLPMHYNVQLPALTKEETLKKMIGEFGNYYPRNKMDLLNNTTVLHFMNGEAVITEQSDIYWPLYKLRQKYQRELSENYFVKGE